MCGEDVGAGGAAGAAAVRRACPRAAGMAATSLELLVGGSGRSKYLGAVLSRCSLSCPGSVMIAPSGWSGGRRAVVEPAGAEGRDERPGSRRGGSDMDGVRVGGVLDLLR